MCEEDKEVLLMLKSLFSSSSSNESFWNDVTGSEQTPCNSTVANTTAQVPHNVTMATDFGKKFYAHVTPFIILLGFIGNTTSLYIYLTKPMKKVSASLFLSAICLSDCLVLMTYVLMDWLYRGLPYWLNGVTVSIVTINGICQIFMISAYMFRFTSAWLILVFTIERFIAVCKPLQQRSLCSRRTSRFSILSVFAGGALLGVSKAAMSSVHEIKNSTSSVCAGTPSLAKINFMFDLGYAALITCIPYLVITVCNILILHELAFKKMTIRIDSTRALLTLRLRRELTLTLLAISTSFVLLNLPYFAFWLHSTILTGSLSITKDPHDFTRRVDQLEYIGNWLYICRTAFYINYAINVFLYYITGSQYRKRMSELLAAATFRFHTAFAFGSRQGFKRPSTPTTTT